MEVKKLFQGHQLKLLMCQTGKKKTEVEVVILKAKECIKHF